MIRKKWTQISLSTDWTDVSEYLRKYSADCTLKRINRESYDLFNNLSNSEIPAVNRVELYTYPNRSTSSEKIETYITAWGLIDLAYYLIKASNDYRGKMIERDEELYALKLVVDNYLGYIENGFVANMDGNEPEFLMYVWGFAGEQFKLETPTTVLDNLSRDLYILFDVNNSCEYDIEDLLKKETNLSWQQLSAFLFLAWIGFSHWDSLQEICEGIRWKNESYKAEFESLVDRYSSNYKEIRESNMERQFLYSHPFIKTQRGEVVSCSAYLNWFLCEHSILWIIRDRYKRLDKQDFTNYYGILFEKYFEELLKFTLKQGEYERIVEDKHSKRADWKISIGNHRFLIEQKSRIMDLSAKQQQTDVDAIRKFAKETVIKAICQLENTEKEYDDGKYIKILLLYEDYLKSELLDSIMSLSECKIDNDNHFWIASINEIEMLFSVAKKDRQLFSDIIMEKTKREVNHSVKGKSIAQIMREKGVYENDYIKRKRIKKYIDEVQDTLRYILKE